MKEVTYLSSRQEMFDHVVSQLIKQRVPSRGYSAEGLCDGTCQYLSAGGKKCAVGHLLPQEILDVLEESENTFTFMSLLKAIKKRCPEASYPPDTELRFIAELQGAHDHTWVENWLFGFLVRAKIVAGEYLLEWKFQEELEKT